MEFLFVYGTLKDPEIRLKLTGKKFSSFKNKLIGFELTKITQDKVSYPIVEITNNNKNIVDGEVIEVNENDLKIFDEYEGHDYCRIEVILEDGIKSWVYCK